MFDQYRHVFNKKSKKSLKICVDGELGNILRHIIIILDKTW